MDPERLGKYELRRVLGKGAMGTVYEGWDPAIARTVAIKTVRLPSGQDPDALEEVARFRREAQAAGRLTHPNIVTVYDTGETGDLAWIVMEYVDGPSLKAAFDRSERMALAEIGRVMEQLLAGLAYSHARGVVHRDIKPANVMLTSEGVVKITDFGIARIESSSMTQAGTVLGTPAYMSPEQFRGEPVDARSDIYSAGVVLYQLLTGERPFDGSISAIMHKVLNTDAPRPSDLAVTAPVALDAVVAQAMARRPSDRFASAAAFATALREAIAGGGATQPVAMGPEAFDPEATVVAAARTAGAIKAPAPPPPAAPRGGARAGVWIGGGAAGLAAIAAAVWFLVPGTPEPAPAPPPQPTRTADATPVQGAPAPRVAPASPQPPRQGEPASPAGLPPVPPPATPPASAGPVPPVSATPDLPPPAVPPPSPAGQPAPVEPAAPTGPAPAAPPVASPAAAGPTADSPPATAPAPPPSSPGRPPLAAPASGPVPSAVMPPAPVGPTSSGPTMPDAPPAATPPSSSSGPPPQAGPSPPAGPVPPASPPPDSPPATVPGSPPPSAGPALPPVPSLPPVSVPPPQAGPALPPIPGQQVASGPVTGQIREALAARLAGLDCTLASGEMDGERARITAITRAGAPETLLRATVAPVAQGRADLRVGVFAADYCPAIDAVRGDADRFGARPSGLSAALRGGGQRLFDQDPVHPVVTMPDFPAHLALLYLTRDDQGKVWVGHLFPNGLDPDRRFAPRQRVELDPREDSGPGRGTPIAVGEPFGTDMMLAIATGQPLFAAPRPQVEPLDALMPDLGAALTALRRQGARVAVSGFLLETAPRP